MQTKSQLKNWHQEKIKNLGRVVTGKTPPTKNQEYYGDKYPFITPTDISDNFIFVDKPERYLSEEGAKKVASSKLPKNSVCYTCIASVGKIAITKEDSFTNQQINSVVADPNEADYRYIFYLLRNITSQIKGMVGGAASPIINKSAFEDVDIDIPDISTQKQIADVLSAYDDLIENNTKRIKILEQIAQAIYKEWFVYFRFPGHEKVKMIDSKTEFGKILEGWEIKSILETNLFSFIYKNLNRFSGTKIYYATADINSTSITGTGEAITYENKPSRAQKEPAVFSVWFARMKDTYKVLGFTSVNSDIAENSILSSGFAGFSCSQLFFPFLYFTISSDRFHSVKNLHCTGATQMSLTNEGLSKILILEPAKKLVTDYGEKVLLIIDEIFLLQKQNQNLRQARDLLLPKLVTGEIEARSESIPKDELMSYLNKLFDKTKDNRLADDKVRSRIIEMMNEACEITELSFSDLLQRLDFKPNNLSIEALESFLAELRSIFWLRDFGFVSIEPLQAMKKSIRPDFIAKHGDRTCCIEVFCLTQTHGQKKDSNLGVYVNFDPQFIGSKFGRDFAAAAQEKKNQLDSVSADIKVLLCVVNSESMLALNTKEEWDRHAKLLYENLSWKKNYYIGILTGAKPNGISSDAIFPKL